MEKPNCRKGYLCIAIAPMCIAAYITLGLLSAAVSQAPVLSLIGDIFFLISILLLILAPTIAALSSIPGYIFAIKAWRNLEPKQDASLILIISSLYLLVGGLLSYQFWSP